MGDALDERGNRAVRARRRRRRRAIGVVVFVLVVIAIVALAVSMLGGGSDSSNTSSGSRTSITTAAPTTTTVPLAGPFRVTTDVNVRDGPGTKYPVHATLEPGTKVKVQCQATGEAVNGPLGPNTKWVKIVGFLVTGYVTTVYIDIGTALDDPAKIPTCPPV